MQQTTVVNVLSDFVTIRQAFKEGRYRYIGRGRCPVTGQQGAIGEWGNKFSHLPRSAAEFRVGTREEAVKEHEKWLRNNPVLLAKMVDLEGMVLGCWCHPSLCHGHTIVKLLKEWRAGTLAIPGHPVLEISNIRQLS